MINVGLESGSTTNWVVLPDFDSANDSNVWRHLCRPRSLYIVLLQHTFFLLFSFFLWDTFRVGSFAFIFSMCGIYVRLFVWPFAKTWSWLVIAVVVGHSKRVLVTDNCGSFSVNTDSSAADIIFDYGIKQIERTLPQDSQKGPSVDLKANKND